MKEKDAVIFIKQEFPEVETLAAAGVLWLIIEGKKFSLELKYQSRETLDRFIKDKKEEIKRGNYGK